MEVCVALKDQSVSEVGVGGGGGQKSVYFFHVAGFGV